MNSDNDLLNQPETVQQKQTSSYRFPFIILNWLFILFLGLFPPVAWYFLWKEKRRHQFFSILLYIYGSIILTSISFYEFFLRPQIARFFGEHWQPAPLDTPIGLVFITLMMIYAVAQIAFGKSMKRAFQKYSCLPRRWLWGTAIIFILDTVFFGFFLPSIMLAWWMLGISNSTGYF